MRLVSIIVPIYNAECFLDRCIESLVKQTYDDLEIVVIDDGSTDKSLDICYEWDKKDNRIRVLHQENKGVTAARNYGITEASGEFITFVDSDDWIDPSFVEKAVNAFKINESVDIVIFGMILNYDDGREIRVGQIGLDSILQQNDAIIEMFRNDFFRWELCGKVYRKGLFEGFQADESIIMCEDLDSNWILFHKARKFYYSCSVDYHYYVNEKSVTKDFDFSKDTTLEVYHKILSSGYYIPFSVKMWIYRQSIIVIARDVREMYFRDPHFWSNKINDYIKELLYLDGLFPDTSISKSELMDVYRKSEEERFGIFNQEFSRLKQAASESSDCQRITIYGIGAAARFLYLSLPDRKRNSISFVVSDSKYSVKRFCGCHVGKASELKPEKNSVIIMTLQNKHRAGVVSELRKNGLENIIEFSIDNNIYINV